ncbi:hypothetical protein AMJ39_02395 [candidate division TA06 bacterium DG_24]|uniref:RNA polymerase sigma-54 factor n=3 Tax=Bacteria division TA06 TaxID=1156500 RepID=A0A0S8JJV8_UNCT6|nr:MAG: hypothetical protein AMJ39_02395 [candidate division TA06 bacterium DG_24]KPK69910.1 MAG: hypothetical protein AMJ82_04440 [candidate division TA06 bacterium SM23_40]KPL10102.1 MAG: hypothetical protein AMJ71_04405 [candidate division TA06 bacterium SM1_40]
MKIDLRHELKLTLAPALIESLKILQLPRVELQQLVRQQLEMNPFLEDVLEEEVEAEEELETTAEEPETTAEEPQEDESSEATDEEKNLEDFDWEEFLQNGVDPGYRPQPDRDDRFQEKVAVTVPTFSDYLMTQLRLQRLPDEDLVIGEFIIGNLDDDGYLVCSIEEIAQILEVSDEDVERVLRIVQTFDPIGIGARDLEECLIIQLRERGLGDSLQARMVTDHLRDIQNRKHSKIAKALGVSVSEVREAVQDITSLEPKPGRRYSTEDVRYVVPDVSIELIDGEHTVFLNERDVPHLRIGAAYRDVLDGSRKASKEERTFVMDRLKAARFLLKGLEQRRTTILKVMRYIVETQNGFFNRGIAHLAPMTLRDVADGIGMHESTVSRVVQDKYVETPHGVFEMRYFFSGGVRTQTSVAISTHSVKARIAELIEKEDKRRPLSDRKVVELLKSEGMLVARRTVAKYRDELHILPARLRKEL